jgi:hypothetical protein
MLFQIYGNIKILTITSKISIIGTISIAGNINEIKDMHVAENPKPLNPLIIDAINTVNKIIKN